MRRGWRGEPGTRAPAGPLVHEPVALKACLCLASLLEAHLLIPTKEKNGVGNMWMSSPPCLGRRGPRARGSAWGKRQGEQILEVLGEAGRKSQVFSVLCTGRETWGEHPSHAQRHYLCLFQALQGVPQAWASVAGWKHSGTFMPHLIALTPAPGTAQDVF